MQCRYNFDAMSLKLRNANVVIYTATSQRYWCKFCNVDIVINNATSQIYIDDVIPVSNIRHQLPQEGHFAKSVITKKVDVKSLQLWNVGVVIYYIQHSTFTNHQEGQSAFYKTTTSLNYV